jgi:hypothetical protein
MFNISSPQCPLTLLILAYNTDYGQLDNAAGPVINSRCTLKLTVEAKLIIPPSYPEVVTSLFHQA